MYLEGGGKVSSIFTILHLGIGSFFYFGYYFLMKDYFGVEPFKYPYLLISIYFIFATVLSPYAVVKASNWLENKSVINFLATPTIVVPISYIFAPVISILSFFKDF